MKTTNQDKTAEHPLSDDELARLDTLLESLNAEEAMVVEEVDGFFAALACSQRPFNVEDYLPVVLGVPVNGIGDAERLADRPDSIRVPASAAATSHAAGKPPAADVAELARLLARHWESVRAQLDEGQGFAPVFSYDEQGRASGNAWAIGFVRGMSMIPDAWAPLEDDDEFVDALDPMMRLVAEVEPPDDEPAERIGDDEREAVIGAMIEGVMDIYDFCRAQRERRSRPN